MENVTHSLLGAALAKTRLGFAAPGAPAALVLAANFPDLENLVLVFLDKPTNMIHHRSVTHSALGLLIEIPLLTLITWQFGRFWTRRRSRPDAAEHVAESRPTQRIDLPDSPAARPSFRLLLTGIALAMLSHPLLDWINTYGVRPWLPFDGTWYHGDLVFIADPYLWLIFGGATALAGRKTRAGSITLTALALFLTAVIIFAAPVAPPALQIIWPIAIVALALGRLRLAQHEAQRASRVPPDHASGSAWSSVDWRRAHAIVATAFVLATVYVGFLGWAGRSAWRRALPVLHAQIHADESIVSRTLSPQPANPLAWEVVAQTQAAVYRLPINLATPPGGVTRVENGLDHPLVRELADTPAGRAWRIFARQPVALVARHADGRRVYLLDARYGLLPPRNFSSFTIDVPDRRAARPH